jgi:two-component sensor histidine kinase
VALGEEGDATGATTARAAAAADLALSDEALENLELRHRMKNVLSIVQSLVNQTLRADVSIEEARSTLTERLIAMGKAVDLLLENAWQSARIDEIVSRGLTHRARFADRFSMEGPALQVGPGAAMSLSLALHELESNAIKYGALSSASGRVTIAWSVDGPDGFRFEWREQGGPPVTPPSRQGFGSKLIGTAVARRVGGHAELAYPPEGLVWILHASAAGLAS